MSAAFSSPLLQLGTVAVLLFLNSKFHLFHSWILLGFLDSASLCCTVETTGSKLEQLQGSPCFLSLRDYRPSLPDVQCFKTVASYILPAFCLFQEGRLSWFCYSVLAVF